MQVGKTIISIIILLTLATQAHAQSVTSKGIANVVLDTKLTSEVRQNAIREAGINALDRYFSETNQAKAKNYELIREEMIGSIDKYVLSLTVLSEDIDGVPLAEAKKAKSGIYTVVVRADINANRINNELKSQSVSSNTSEEDKSFIALVFVARRQISVQSFDDKVYKRTDVNESASMNANSQDKVSETEDIRDGSVALQDSSDSTASINKDATTAVTTGGSRTAKADLVKWDVTTASEVNIVMEGVFSSAGYEVVAAEYLEDESDGLVDIQAIRNDYQTGDDLAAATMRNLTKGVKSVDVPYLALGTLDVGLQSIDPASGLVRVNVTVTGKVLALSGRFPKTASAVGPFQVAGLGPNESEARTKALKQAGEIAAKQLTDELNAKGFH